MRLVLDAPLPGRENMDRDLALLDAGGPVLRLYSWVRPCLSLGYAQRDGWVDRERLAGLGVEVVRRPTGGRALLHLPGEITYCVVLPSEGSVREAFQRLAGRLASALRSLGVPVDTAGGGGAPPSTADPSCLAVIAPGEVTAGGRKLVGSAQVRRRGRLLQHGQIPRRSDPALLAAVIPGAVPGADLASLGFEHLDPKDLGLAFIRWQDPGNVPSTSR